MPCDYCLTFTKKHLLRHTLSKCTKIENVVMHYQSSMDYMISQESAHLDYIKNWVREIPTAILKRLLKYNGKRMNQTRNKLEEELMRIVFHTVTKIMFGLLQQINNINVFIEPDMTPEKIKEYATQNKISRVTAIFAYTNRFFDLIHTFSTPFKFSNFVRQVTHRCQVIKTQTCEYTEDYYIVPIQKLMFEIKISKEKIVEFRYQKYGPLLSHLNYNRDIFRTIVSYI